jgi:hypothetical protein
MGLKFRRGTTAQKSGSLAFGEPYVNTDLGTLQIGGLAGDITLGASGTGSAGSFSAISGSGLDITGNANIAGNVTVGGQLTIGDQTSDTVNVVASLSSSLIPQTTNAFDLGSATKIWRDLYISTGSIKFIDGSGAVASTLTANSLNSISSNTASVNTFTASVNGHIVDINTKTGSLETKNTTLATYTASLETKNTTLATYTASVSGHITDINTKTGSFETKFSTLQNLTGSFETQGGGIISSSAQLNNTTITNLTVTNLTTVNETASVIFSSGSNTFGDFGNDTHNFTGSVKVSGSITTIGASTATSYNGIINATNGIVSGSSQITYTGISSIPGGIVSGSTQTITNLPTGTVSGSSQIVSILSSLNTYTGSNDTTNTAQSTRLTTLESVTGSYETKGRGVVSGSAQIDGSLLGSNKTITIGSTSTTLGGTSTTIAGLTSVTSTTFVGALTGNASTATTAAALTTARTINGTSFDGSANITIPNLVSGSAQVTLSSTTGGGTSSNVQFNSLGIGMAASATAGRIDATNDVVAFSSSDIRFKENIVPIENALDKISKISGNTYDWKAENKIEHGYEGNDVGVIAQEIEAVLPQLVQTRENGFKAVKYDKLVALLIEGIKEQQQQIEKLRMDLDNYECKCDNCKSK